MRHTFRQYMLGELLVHVQLIQGWLEERQHLLIRNDPRLLCRILKILVLDVLPEPLNNLHRGHGPKTPGLTSCRTRYHITSSVLKNKASPTLRLQLH